VVGQQNADIVVTLQLISYFAKGRCHGNDFFYLSVYGVYIGATWRIRLNRPCAVAMRPYVKVL